MVSPSRPSRLPHPGRSLGGDLDPIPIGVISGDLRGELGSVIAGLPSILPWWLTAKVITPKL